MLKRDLIFSFSQKILLSQDLDSSFILPLPDLTTLIKGNCRVLWIAGIVLQKKQVICSFFPCKIFLGRGVFWNSTFSETERSWAAPVGGKKKTKPENKPRCFLINLQLAFLSLSFKHARLCPWGMAFRRVSPPFLIALSRSCVLERWVLVLPVPVNLTSVTFKVGFPLCRFKIVSLLSPRALSLLVPVMLAYLKLLQAVS